MRASREYARRGFTLVEMMGVVMILVIAFAIAVPSAFNVRANLRMMQLDARAQQVYNAAQNRLTSLQATGQLEALRDELGSDHVLADKSQRIVPVDYPRREHADASYWTTHELCYLHSSDAVTSRYLLTEAGTPLTRNLNDGYFAIEFSPLTAEVYSVFYWETDANISSESAASVSYADLVGACPADRSRATRTPLRLGYYNGGELGSHIATADTPTTPQAFDIQVVNSEELYVRVSGGGKNSGSLGIEGFDPKRIKSVSVSVDDVDDFLVVEDDDLLVDSVKGIDVRFILDSMRTDCDMHFKTLAAGHPNLVPGMDVTIKVQAVYETAEGPQTYTLSNTQGIQNFTVNSLFESNENGTVKVSCVRHLNNLRQSALKQDQALSNYTNIEVTRDIDFDGTTWKTDGNPDLNQTVSATSRAAGTSAENLNPLRYFAPISGSETNAFRPTDANKDTEAVFNGKGHALVNFRIGAGSEKTDPGTGNDTRNVGLFNKVFFKMRDLTMRDVHVVGGTHVGAFAGAAGGNASFDNCDIVGTSTVRGASEVGGVAGIIEKQAVAATLSNCDVYVSVACAGDNAGGIVGLASSCGSLESCTVNGTVTARAAAGGIIGRAACELPALARCLVGPQSKALVVATGPYAGGVVGVIENDAFVRDCTVLADVQAGVDAIGASYAGGIAGCTESTQTTGARLSGCKVDTGSSVEAFGMYAGGLAGYFKGSASDCRSIADVSAGASAGYSFAGGAFGVIRNDQVQTFKTCRVGTSTKAASVSATGSHVGGFAGTALRAHISKSRVYGATWVDGAWQHARVSGADYTGGFLGMTGYLDPETGDVTDPDRNGLQAITSFTAIDVWGRSGADRVGGFVGFGSGQSVICYCYASGKVHGTTNVGGFAGKWENDSSLATLDSCYTTSDVTGSSKTGGFAGTFTRTSASSSKKLARCISYGLVRVTHDGATYIGPFCGNLHGAGDVGIADNYYAGGCAFLVRTDSGYNTFTAQVIQPEGRNDDQIRNVLSSYRISSADSHPYATELQGERFPYSVVVYEETALPHFGNWPLPARSQR